MSNGDTSESFKTLVSEALPGALTELFDRWPRRGIMQSVNLSQQANILSRVARDKTFGR